MELTNICVFRIAVQNGLIGTTKEDITCYHCNGLYSSARKLRCMAYHPYTQVRELKDGLREDTSVRTQRTL